MGLVDIGANLTHESFRHDLADVLARARSHGVAQLVVTGASAQGSRDAVALAEQHPGMLVATAGVHPHHAAAYDGEVDDLLRELAAHDAVRAVGETGLDYFRDLAPRDAQRFAFEQQLKIAIATGKPLFLHQRDAHADFVEVLKPLRTKLGAIVVHCFTGTRDEMRDYLAMDLHIGITGWICDERRGLHLRDIVGEIPADRLMIETDCPYLMPRDLPQKPSHRRNEPMFLPHIARAVADARGEPVDETIEATTRTARRFFALPDDQVAGSPPARG